jgi:ATP-dependent protease Clp ATPase subunit
MLKRDSTDNALCCSFCHKSQDAVGKLISSPSEWPRVYICNECVMVCFAILEDDAKEANVPAARSPKTAGSPKTIVLEPEVAEVFPDSDSVNDALAELILIAMRIKTPGS